MKDKKSIHFFTTLFFLDLYDDHASTSRSFMESTAVYHNVRVFIYPIFSGGVHKLIKTLGDFGHDINESQFRPSIVEWSERLIFYQTIICFNNIDIHLRWADDSTTIEYQSSLHNNCTYINESDLLVPGETGTCDLAVIDGGSRIDLMMINQWKSRNMKILYKCNGISEQLTVEHLLAFDRIVSFSPFIKESIKCAFGLNVDLLPYPPNPCSLAKSPVIDRYLTFVDPTLENGVYLFAKIAEQIGIRRPDIPILVVEGHGMESDVAGCGLELNVFSNIYFHRKTLNTQKYWEISRVCLAPMMCHEKIPVSAIEAVSNGIPVIQSNRSSLIKNDGKTVITIPAPERVTSRTRLLPTIDEVTPWIDAIIDLWDHSSNYQSDNDANYLNDRFYEISSKSISQNKYIEEIINGNTNNISSISHGMKSVILVPFLNHIEHECETGLRERALYGRRRIPVQNDRGTHRYAPWSNHSRNIIYRTFMLRAGWISIYRLVHDRNLSTASREASTRRSSLLYLILRTILPI